jgi:flavin-dependent dehydrogenase
VHDVVLLGAGPAGCATAIALADAGLSVAVVSRTARREPVGECLAPAAMPLLRTLGVDDLADDGHLPCHGTTSVWGSDTPQSHSFLTEPWGHGWHLDRRRFDARLENRARQAGVVVEKIDGAAAVTDIAAGWEVETPGARRRCAFLVDATGRASWLGRRQGARRVEEDRQVAMTVFLRATNCDPEDTTTLVESVPGGWWYSALLPEGRLVAALTTDPDLLVRVESRAALEQLLETAPTTHARLNRHGAIPEGDPQLGPASGGILDPAAGTDWLAVGDAALSYDPLAGHGLTAALAGARDAAVAISATLGGSGDALGAYRKRVATAHTNYSRARREIYEQEQRWAGEPFWRRRHAAVGVPESPPEM